MGLLHGPEKADYCDRNAAGQIVPSRTADGTLTKVGDIFYVHRDGSDDVFVAACFPRKGGTECHGPENVVKGHSNEPAHVEFCGKTVSRMTLAGREVSLSIPTQEMLNALNAKERRVEWVVLGTAALMIGGSVIGIRVARKKL